MNAIIRCLLGPERERSAAARRLTACAFVVLMAAATISAGCGESADAQEDEAGKVAALSADTFTGALIVSSLDTSVGTPITVTQSATNLGPTPLYPIIVGIYRVGFKVQNVTRPATGICRIAGSATCNFINLAPGETQSYTLTLLPMMAGSFQIRGWTSSSYVSGGAWQAVTVNVR
jgi:hypothetical protein